MFGEKTNITAPHVPTFLKTLRTFDPFSESDFFVRQKHISIVRVWTPEEGFWQQWLLRANRRRQTHRHNLYPTTRKLNSSYCCSSWSQKNTDGDILAGDFWCRFNLFIFWQYLGNEKSYPPMAKQPGFQCCFSFYNEARRCNGKLTDQAFLGVGYGWFFSSYMIVLCYDDDDCIMLMIVLCSHLMMMIIVMLMIVLFTISGAAKWLNEGEIGQICKR